MQPEFGWSPATEKTNRSKQGVSFAEAVTIFRDRPSMTIVDHFHSEYEDRFITIGLSERDRLLVIVHTDEIDRIRIVSARRATRKEKALYEEG